MIPIKIQCGCGQRYAFDVEPINGQLASPVNCPACGTDGSAAVNVLIAQSLAPPPAEPALTKMRLQRSSAEPPSPGAVRPTGSLPSGAPNASQLGLVDRQQAEVEARAKVSWGDPQEAVLKYLMIQGFPHDEASALIAAMYKERALAVRGKGVKKILTGCLMIAVAAAGMLYMLSIKVIDGKLFGILFALAVWGLWIAVNGAIMVAVPKMQSGDVAEQ